MSENFDVFVGVNQGSAFSQQLYAIVTDYVTNEKK